MFKLLLKIRRPSHKIQQAIEVIYTTFPFFSTLISVDDEVLAEGHIG